MPSHEELIKINQDVLSLEVQAHEFLEKEGYTPADANRARALLTYTLLLLTHCMPPNILPRGIQAVMTLLEHEETSKVVEAMALLVMRRVDLLVNLMEHATKSVQESVMDTRGAATMMYNTWEEVRDEVQKVVDAAKEDLQGTVKETKEELQKAVKGMEGAGTVGARQWVSGMGNMRSAEMGTMSYMAMTMLNSGLPTMHANTLARTQLMEYQVVIDKDPQVGSNGLDEPRAGIGHQSEERHWTRWWTR